MNESEPIKQDPYDDPDFQAIAANWIYLTPWQKKIIVWRASLIAIRTRAFRFLKKITGGKPQ
jgi:hypothetical protein